MRKLSIIKHSKESFVTSASFIAFLKYEINFHQDQIDVKNNLMRRNLRK